MHFYLGQSIVFKMINLIPMQTMCVNLYVLMPNLVILDTGSLSYCPPHSCFKTRADLLSHTQSLLHLLDKVSNKDFIVIVGDFNLPKIDWSTFNFAIDGVHDVIFNRISQLGHTQFVDELTRLNNSAIGNTLDLIFSNDPMSINITNYSTPISSSDHCVVNFNVFSYSTKIT